MSSGNSFNGRMPLAVNVIHYARVEATKMALTLVSFAANDITRAV